MNGSTVLRHIFGSSIIVLLAISAQAAPTVWNGPTTTFTKANGANPTLAANQDRLTADTWITRGNSQGLFNAHNESFFTHSSSPSGTEWASGSLANFASLTYHDWNTWAKGVNPGPTSTVGVDAVLHIIPDDIYLSVRFTSWASGHSGGVGGFSYIRSTPTAVPEPSSVVLFVMGGLGLVFATRRSARKRSA